MNLCIIIFSTTDALYFGFILYKCFQGLLVVFHNIKKPDNTENYAVRLILSFDYKQKRNSILSALVL